MNRWLSLCDGLVRFGHSFKRFRWYIVLFGRFYVVHHPAYHIRFFLGEKWYVPMSSRHIFYPTPLTVQLSCSTPSQHSQLSHNLLSLRSPLQNPLILFCLHRLLQALIVPIPLEPDCSKKTFPNLSDSLSVSKSWKNGSILTQLNILHVISHAPFLVIPTLKKFPRLYFS